jgi:hypothetical protein
MDAVGLQFLQRLLLPLSRRAAEPVSATHSDALQQAQVSCSLGLSVLSAACRLPDVAGSAGLLQLLPAMVAVISAGGVGPALSPRAAAGSAAPQDDAAGAATVVDALECAVACVSAQPQLAAGAAAASGALAAAAAAAGRGLAAGHATQQMLAVQLMAALLVSWQQQQQQQHQQQQDTCEADAAAASHAVATLMHAFAAPGGTPLGTQQRPPLDAAMVQLEALHTLLLVLPADADSLLGAHLAAAAAGGDDWPHQARCGVLRMLRSRGGAVQKRSALRLAAACVELVGPSWLLPPRQAGAVGVGPGPAASGDGGSGGGGALARALLAALLVETPLLLSDAMDPGVWVPAEGRLAVAEVRAPAATDTVMPDGPADEDSFPGDAQQQTGQQDDGSNQGDAQQQTGQQDDGSNQGDAQQHAGQQEDGSNQGDAQHHAGQQEQADVEGSEEGAAAAVGRQGLAAAVEGADQQQTAGQRAAAGLPCCFLLVEALTDALAADAALAEGLLGDGRAPARAGWEEEEMVLPALEEAAAQKLVTQLMDMGQVRRQAAEGPRAVRALRPAWSGFFADGGGSQGGGTWAARQPWDTG